MQVLLGPSDKTSALKMPGADLDEEDNPDAFSGRSGTPSLPRTPTRSRRAHNAQTSRKHRANTAQITCVPNMCRLHSASLRPVAAVVLDPATMLPLSCPSPQRAATHSSNATMPVLGDDDIEMQALDESALTMPGGDLHFGNNPDTLDKGSGDPSLTHTNSKGSSRRGSSRKGKSSDRPSRYGIPLPGSFTSPQDANVGGRADMINNPDVAGGVQVTTNPKPMRKTQGADEEWSKFAGELDKNDRTMMETAKDSVDSLLVFAGLFSAVVTAFCILTLALLQPDPADSTAVILAQISQQLGGLTIDGGRITSVQLPYALPARFRATTPQIVVNVLLFSSLILALISASLGIIVKQWMREYAAPTSSQTTEHLCIRQYRFDGLRRWRVDVVMRTLPLLLQLSLLLFFVGLSILLWTISTPVAAVGTILVAIWLVSWLLSICLPTFYADCPYKSAESTIFFTLVQFAKSILFPGIARLSFSLLGEDQPRWLRALYWTLTEIDTAIPSYSSWRDREKGVVQKDMERLMQRTIISAHENVMDESMLEVARGAYVKSSEIDKNVDLLLTLFSDASGYSEERLRSWLPYDTRRIRSLVCLTMDTLAAADQPFQDIEPATRTKRESLLDVISAYLNFQGKECQSEDVIQQLLNFPSRVDFLGASSGSLRGFTHALWFVQSQNRVVRIEAIASIARGAVHSSDTDSTPEDYSGFVELCGYLLKLLMDRSRHEILSPQAGPLLKDLVTAISKTVEIIQEHMSPMTRSHMTICEVIHEFAEKQPALKHDMRDPAMALLRLYTDPPYLDTPPLPYHNFWTAQYHRATLNALWGVYNDCAPPSFPLIPSVDTVRGP